MTLAYALIPHVSHFDRADITAWEALRHRHRSEAREHDTQLALTSFVLKATVAALKRHPQFNASVDHLRGEVVVKHYDHLGVAVDTDRGLIVPVLRNVDRKSIWELSLELRQLAERPRAGKVGGEDLRGGTFTITNIASLGGTGMVPVINYPEVAILGLAHGHGRNLWCTTARSSRASFCPFRSPSTTVSQTAPMRHAASATWSGTSRTLTSYCLMPNDSWPSIETEQRHYYPTVNSSEDRI